MDFLIISVLFFLGFILGFVLGNLTVTKRFNDDFYDFGFVSGYEACRSDYMEVKNNEVPYPGPMDTVSVRCAKRNWHGPSSNL